MFYDPSLVTPAWVEAVRGLVTERTKALRVLRFAKAAKRHNIENRLGDIRVPTLIVWGKEDRITPVDVGQRFHALIPDSQYWVLTNCGHAPMLEQPHAFNAIVGEWLHETWPRRAQLVIGSATPCASWRAIPSAWRSPGGRGTSSMRSPRT